MKRILHLPLRILSILIALVYVLGFGKATGEEFDVRDPGACKLNFTVLSDVHVETNNFTRYRIISHSLQNVPKNKSGNDAVVFLGDSTMNSQYLENAIFHGTAALLLKNEKIISVLGNHDAGNSEGDYEKIMKRWYRFTDAFFGYDLAQPYHYDVIDGFYFIVLGSELNRVYECVISEAQFAWLEQVLSLAAESGKPCFVFNHFPLNCMTDENLQHTDRLTNILRDYAAEHDLFYVCGHYHTPLSRGASFREDYGFPQINAPSLSRMGGEDGMQIDDRSGEGIVVELYADHLLVRGRNFYESKWKYDAPLTLCERTYPLKHPLS